MDPRVTLRRFRNRLARTALHKPLAWFRHRSLRPGDVVLASYPRSGKTWLRFMLFQLLSERPSEFEQVDSALPELGRAPGLPLLPGGGRLLATHESYRAEYSKAVYLVRDVRDVVISEYEYHRLSWWENGEFSAFLQRFLEGRVNAFGAWHRNVDSWLQAAAAHRVAVLVLRYEEMRANPEKALSVVLEFLGCAADPDRIRAAIEGNSFQKMREKEERARQGPFKLHHPGMLFVRQGKAGGWEGHLTEKELCRIEEICGPVLLRLGYPLRGSTAA